MTRFSPVLWLAAMTIAALTVAYKTSVGLPIDTNILTLLPHAVDETWVDQARNHTTALISRRILFLVGHRDLAVATQASGKLRDSLVRAGLVEPKVASKEPAALNALGTRLFPYRGGLLSRQDRQLLLAGRGGDIMTRALAELYSPIGIVDADVIERDPFLLFSSYFAGMRPSNARVSENAGIPSVSDNAISYVLLNLSLSGDPYSMVFQERMESTIQRWLDTDRLVDTELRVLRTGAIFYAAESARDGQMEASVISSISAAGVLLLTILVFRSMRPVFLVLVAVSSGILCGLAICLMVFDTIHLVALVFGASLIGVSVDYAFHFCCSRFDPTQITAADRLSNVLPGLNLGLVSSVIGFLTFALVPFPGLRQIAVFSAIGLCASYCTVVILFPRMDDGPPYRHGADIVRFSNWSQLFWRRGDWRIWQWGAIILLGLVAAAGLLRFQIDDDLRRLQPLSAHLKAQEREIQRLLGESGSTLAIAVYGENSEKALQREEQVIDRIAPLIEQGLLSNYSAVSRIVPSAKRQRKNIELVNSALLDLYLASYLDRIGLTSTVAKLTTDQPPLTLGQLEDVIPEVLRIFRSDRGDGDISLNYIILSGIRDSTRIEELIAEWPDVRLLDQGREIAVVLEAYRNRVLAMLVVAGLLILTALCFRFGVKSGLRVIVAPTIAVASTPLILALFGEVFSLFNAMALILVLAVGLDYAIFSAEAKTSHMRTTALSIGISAISTILVFGLLAFSDLYAVHAFGVTVLVGIVVAYLFTPLTLKPIRETT